jgi:hypothetical protein
MYVNNKIYKNTLSTYTRKKENAYNIAAKAWNKKNFCTPNAISDKPHSEFGTRFWHYHPGDKMSRLSSHSFYNNPIF